MNDLKNDSAILVRYWSSCDMIVTKVTQVLSFKISPARLIIEIWGSDPELYDQETAKGFHSFKTNFARCIQSAFLNDRANFLTCGTEYGTY